MSGGLIQLAAIGDQNKFLTCQPQITLFKMQYRRHVHFAMDTHPIEFSGSVNFGQRFTCTIPMKGDLLTHLVLNLNLPNLNPGATTLEDMEYFWVDSIGHLMIENVELEIGTQTIDQQTGMWMDNWTEFTQTEQKRYGFYDMIGKIGNGDTSTTEYPEYGRAMDLYVPLHFWFCRNPGSSLPLIAMQNTKVKIHITIRPLHECNVSKCGTKNRTSLAEPLQARMYADYVSLDSKERLKIARKPHLYLIDQVQTCGPFNINKSQRTITFRLTLNHPVKELFWFYQRNDICLPNNQWFNYGLTLESDDPSTEIDTIMSAQIKFNGKERTVTLPAKFFRLWQPYKHHTRIPNKPIYVYSFAQQPEDIQPSGSCNFSKINNAMLTINFRNCIRETDGMIHIFAVNHNVLYIKNGKATLMFNN